MPRTISDEEWAYLQAQNQIAQLVSPVYDNPKTKRHAQALLKEAYPNLPIPDYDQWKAIEDRFASEKKQKDDAEAAERKKKQDDDWADKRRKTQAEYSLTDEGMKDLDKWMWDNSVGDYEVAASYRASKTPRPVEDSWAASRWQHDKAPGYAEIAKDPEAWGHRQIAEAYQRVQDRIRQQG